ncbi:MAG: fibronectin type III domain-containing protein [Akkermansiaceae bacterium]
MAIQNTMKTTPEYPKRSFSKRFALAAAAIVATAGMASAEIISVSFDASTSVGSPNFPTSELAGAPDVRVSNWNPWYKGDFTVGDEGQVIVDSSGASVAGFQAFYTGDDRWGQRQVGSGINDARMFGNVVDVFGGGKAIEVSGVPYGAYDVYIYMYDDTDGRAGSFTIGDVTYFARGISPRGSEGAGIPTDDGSGYLLSADTSQGNSTDIDQGNYVKFSNLTEASFVLDLGAINAGNLDRNKVSGFQIVERLANLPVLNTLVATDVTVETATANGDLVNSGDDGDTAEITIYWGTSDGLDDALAWDNSISAGALTAPGAFSASLSGLIENTTYYFRAYAENGAGGEWALASESFTTLPSPDLPEVENLTASAVALDTATLNGELLNNGNGADQSDVVIYWGTVDGGTDSGTWANSNPVGSFTAPGTFNVPLTGLLQNTVYFYRAFASNNSGDDWAPSTESFTTLLPEVGAISLNFVRGSTGATALADGDVAGVVPASRWNNSTTANANAEVEGIILRNDLGNNTSAVATWQTAGTSWSIGTAGTGSAADIKMMTGYLDQIGDGADQVHMINISDIPFRNYDVYLYHSSSGGANRTARYSANGVDFYTRNLDPANVFNGFVNAQYGSLGDAVNIVNPAGNFVLWENLSGDLTIEGQGFSDSDGGSGGEARRAPIQGIQIVASEAPKPFVITAIDYDDVAGTVTLTFNSELGVAYAVDYSTTMDSEEDPNAWIELQDLQAEDTTTTVVDELAAPKPERRFYRVRRL